MFYQKKGHKKSIKKARVQKIDTRADNFSTFGLFLHLLDIFVSG